MAKGSGTTRVSSPGSPRGLRIESASAPRLSSMSISEFLKAYRENDAAFWDYSSPMHEKAEDEREAFVAEYDRRVASALESGEGIFTRNGTLNSFGKDAVRSKIDRELEKGDFGESTQNQTSEFKLTNELRVRLSSQGRTIRGELVGNGEVVKSFKSVAKSTDTGDLVDSYASISNRLTAESERWYKRR